MELFNPNEGGEKKDLRKGGKAVDSAGGVGHQGVC